jgi:16S rRNA processing protein RimM
MITASQLSKIGKYNKIHGVAGELSASFTCEVDAVSHCRCLISSINGIFVPFFYSSLRPKGVGSLLVKIDGIKSEQDAKLLVGKEMYALSTDIDSATTPNFTGDEDELPVDFFIGFALRDSVTGREGKIVDVDTSTDNYLFVADFQGTDVFVPAVDDFIESVDVDSKLIVMALPDGLLDLK